MKALELDNRELRQANEILRNASAYFAMAELDRPASDENRSSTSTEASLGSSRSASYCRLPLQPITRTSPSDWTWIAYRSAPAAISSLKIEIRRVFGQVSESKTFDKHQRVMHAAITRTNGSAMCWPISRNGRKEHPAPTVKQTALNTAIRNAVASPAGDGLHERSRRNCAAPAGTIPT